MNYEASMGHNFQQHPHRRRNVLTGEWVFVSPHRTAGHWLGMADRVVAAARPAHDPQCYLCADNRRASGEINPLYTGTFVFRNDYAAFLERGAGDTSRSTSLLEARAQACVCRVLCFSEAQRDLTPDIAARRLREVCYPGMEASR